MLSLEFEKFKRVRRWCRIWTIILLLIPFLLCWFFTNVYTGEYNDIVAGNKSFVIGFSICILAVCLYVVLIYFCIIKPSKKYSNYYKEYFVLLIEQEDISFLFSCDVSSSTSFVLGSFLCMVILFTSGFIIKG